jgi:electron transfer flavoprotein beta subunit
MTGLIVACLTHGDLRPEVDPLSGRVTVDELAAGPAPTELAALEHALRIGEAWSARVLAVVAGPPSADNTLRQAASVGADVLRVAWPPASAELDVAADEHPVAAAVANAVRSIGAPDVVVCGDRSAQRGTGAFPGLLAHELGAAQALGLVSLAVPPGSGGDRWLFGERRLEGGRRERLRVRPPAVVSVEAAGVRLRRAPLPAVLAANRAPVPVSAAAPVGTAALRVGAPRPFRPRSHVVPPPPGSDPHQRLLALTGALAAREPPTVVGPLDPPAAADVILEFLRGHGYLD